MPETKFDPAILESNIKLLLQKRGIIQETLARHLNMSQSTFNKRLKGHPCFSIEDMFKISQYFHVSIDSLCSNSFSDVLNKMPDTKDETKSEDEQYRALSGNAAVYAVCQGLAATFKHGYLLTGVMHLREVVYQEDIDQYHNPTGFYSQKKDEYGLDPTNDYPAIYFSNYWPVDFTYELDEDIEDIEDYKSDILHGGNFNDMNYQVNKFFKKLVDLNDTYKKKSIKYEDYCRSIDNLLKELPKE